MKRQPIRTLQARWHVEAAGRLWAERQGMSLQAEFLRKIWLSSIVIHLRQAIRLLSKRR